MACRWGLAGMLAAMSLAGLSPGAWTASAQTAPPQHSDPAKRPAKRPAGEPASRAGYWLAERKPVVEDLPGGSTPAQGQAAAASALQLEHILRADPPGSGDSDFPHQLFEKMTGQFPWQAVAAWLRGA